MKDKTKLDQMGSLNQGGGLANYLRTIGTFSRNARLFLVYSLLSLLGGGIWRVMFNLYLLAAGFDIAFMSEVLAVNFLFHGLFAFPAGLIADKVGRRMTFVLATILSLIAGGMILFTLDSTFLLVLAAVRGMGEGFHGVAGAPFIMENSQPEERSHLFSLSSALEGFSATVGNLAGGFLPVVWAWLLGVPSVAPAAARWALVTSLPLTFIGLVPLMFIREKPLELVESFAELFALRNLVNRAIIFKLALCSLIVGLGFGFVTPFFNVFFAEVHSASYEQVGTIMAIGSVGGAAAILLSPFFRRRWGMTKSTTIAMTAAVPFVFFMAAVPNLPLAVGFFLARAAFWSISMPLRSQLSMEFVVAKERATTAGLIHACFDVPVFLATLVAGSMMNVGNYLASFSVAAVILFVPAPLYYMFFMKIEEQRRAAVPVSGLMRST